MGHAARLADFDRLVDAHAQSQRHVDSHAFAQPPSFAIAFTQPNNERLAFPNRLSVPGPFTIAEPLTT